MKVIFVSVLAWGISGLASLAGGSPGEVEQLIRQGEIGNLNRSQIDVLLRFIRGKEVPEGMAKQQFDVLRNDAADVLLSGRGAVPGLHQALLRMADSADYDLVWREYIVQKLPDLYAMAGNERERGEVLTALRQKTGDRDYYFSGTALLGLYRLWRDRDAVISTDELRERAWLIIGDEAYQDGNRASALQVAALTGDERAAAQARVWLADRSVPVPLRSSALATLGMVRESEDRALLEQYARNPEYRLRTAARASLRALDDEPR